MQDPSRNKRSSSKYRELDYSNGYNSDNNAGSAYTNPTDVSFGFADTRTPTRMQLAGYKSHSYDNPGFTVPAFDQPPQLLYQTPHVRQMAENNADDLATTVAPLQEGPDFEGEVRIVSQEWDDEMADTSSDTYRDTASQIEQELDASFRQSDIRDDYNYTKVTGLRQGSVVAIFIVVLKLPEQANPQAVERVNRIKENANLVRTALVQGFQALAETNSTSITLDVLACDDDSRRYNCNTIADYNDNSNTTIDDNDVSSQHHHHRSISHLHINFGTIYHNNDVIIYDARNSHHNYAKSCHYDNTRIYRQKYTTEDAHDARSYNSNARISHIHTRSNNNARTCHNNARTYHNNARTFRNNDRTYNTRIFHNKTRN
nr:hypothetical protein BaRGS_016723 [Batillaria attramentaria]